ncbi:hypothetical protein [Bifidobacterium callitrichos]|uniref:hypothetical protein n=1 Tax=Bifidobacterium callitrichos TaxID=762209 RepID=UPI0012E04607|nr:hypothetical protein [Bifidobacterium callitrichos]
MDGIFKRIIAGGVSSVVCLGVMGVGAMTANAKELPCDFRCYTEINASDSQDYSLAISASRHTVRVYARAIQDGLASYNEAGPGGRAIAEKWGSLYNYNDDAKAGRLG